jgi:hypothetical protein
MTFQRESKCKIEQLTAISETSTMTEKYCGHNRDYRNDNNEKAS